MEHGFWSGSTADFGAHVCCRQKPWAGGSNSSVSTRHVPQESRHARGSTAMVENSFFSKSSHVVYTKLLYT